MTTTIEVLGEVAIVPTGAPRAVLLPRQPQTVACLLILERHRSVTRGEVAEVLWDGDLPAHWAGAVRGVISKVRTFLAAAGAESWLRTTADGWRLVLPTEIEVDREACEDTVVAAEMAHRSDPQGDPTSAGGADLLATLGQVERRLAVGLVPGVMGSWWDRRQAETAALRVRSLTMIYDLARERSLRELALRTASELVELEPFSDRAGRRLIEAYADCGDRRAAVAAHDGLVRRLREVGLRVAPETEALARTIRGIDLPIGSPMADVRAVGPLLGRGEELSVALGAWQQVEETGSAQGLVLLGEAGVGKTRLALELSRGENAGPVLWGRCSADRQVAFEPVVQVLAHAYAQWPDVFAAVGPLRRHLKAVLPELGASDALSTEVVREDRSLFFRAVVAAMRAVAVGPSIWVIDDLQWATEDTVALLTHLLPAVADLPVLLVVTCRATAASTSTVLSTLARAMPTVTQRLGGLDQESVAALLTADGVADGQRISQAVLERTGGNPFFVRELARSAGPDGHLDPGELPPNLQSWIDRSVEALGPSLEAVLTAASLLGPQATATTLAAVLDAPERDLVDRVEALVTAGMLVDAADSSALTFNHVLTRDAVRERIGTTRRRFLHREIARVLVESGTPDPGIVASHLMEGGPDVAVATVAAMLRAGEAALAELTWSTALDWFDGVLAHGSSSEADQIAALVGSGTALRGLGDRATARDRLQDAVDRARGSGDARAAAAATLVLVGGGARGVSDDAADEERARLLRDALDHLSGEGDDDLRIPLQIELSLALLLTDQRAEREGLALDALTRARRLGRKDLLASALLGSRVALVGPEHAEARLERMADVLVLPHTDRSHAVTMGALMGQVEDHLLRGDRTQARACLAAARHEVEDRGHPYWRWVVETWGVLDHIIDGNLDQAETSAFEALSWQPDHPEAMACLGVNLVDIRLFQGRSGEMTDLLASAAEQNPQIPAYRAVLALCLAEAGRIETASDEYRRFASDDFHALPEDTNRFLALAVLADVAATIGDTVGAAVLFDLLEPHAGRQVILNCFAGGGSYWGPVATQLGRLCATLCRPVDAERFLAQAAAEAEAFGAPLALARTRQSS